MGVAENPEIEALKVGGERPHRDPVGVDQWMKPPLGYPSIVTRSSCRQEREVNPISDWPAGLRYC